MAGATPAQLIRPRSVPSAVAAAHGLTVRFRGHVAFDEYGLQFASQRLPRFRLHVRQHHFAALRNQHARRCRAQSRSATRHDEYIVLNLHVCPYLVFI
jgi:hypothetical protein